MKHPNRFIIAVSFVLAAAGFLLPWWPLSVLGILIAGLSGRWWLALLLGVLLDLAYGAPPGRLHFLVFPFTIFALALVVLRSLATRYFLDKHPPETL